MLAVRGEGVARRLAQVGVVEDDDVLYLSLFSSEGRGASSSEGETGSVLKDRPVGLAPTEFRHIPKTMTSFVHV